MAYRVEVYESGWVRVMQTGDGVRWNRKKAEQIKARAIVRAPKRTGRLAASHRVEQNRNQLGQFQTGFTISAETGYARFVHDGTGIHGPGGRGLIVRRMSIPAGAHSPGFFGSGPRIIFRSRGQRAQPWLAQAARDVVGV
ncbi:hypothetical protein SEA_PHINKY_39 [Microbacterium phage Phinky]|nr:hypothetical protein SEA_PHINKY_39 [Microbacterium phage Phinky]